MPVISLPDEPNFEQLRKQAKDLRRAVLAGDPGALAEVAEHFPGNAGPVLLRTAQLVVARRYGFASWARLKRHVEIIEHYSRFPDRVEDHGALDDTFLRLACLSYADDEPERWAQARQLLAEHPEITGESVHAAAAAADTAALRRFLDADPAAARLEGGPFRWEPLVYLAYARHDPKIEAGAVLTAARLLLAAGADPNAGYLWHGRRRLGDSLDTPAEMIRGQLIWAITHGMTERVHLLVSHGADVVAPFAGGASTTSVAATTGHADLVDYLVAHGAPPLDLDPTDAFIAAVLAADRAAADRLRSEHLGLADEVRSARPALLTWAAACDRPAAVEILAELGFDVNAKGRTDMPSDQPWQTALHKAAEDGNLELARTLLRLGADPGIRDHRFNGTPLSWARHFGQQELIELLEPLTAPEPDS